MIKDKIQEKIRSEDNEKSTKDGYTDDQVTVRDWNVVPSSFSLNTLNPIRAIVEHLAIEPNPEKSFIPLSVGELIKNCYVRAWKQKKTF